MCKIPYQNNPILEKFCISFCENQKYLRRIEKNPPSQNLIRWEQHDRLREKLYELREFTSNITTIGEIIMKIKKELQINCFNKIPFKLTRVLGHISAKNYIKKNYVLSLKGWQIHLIMSENLKFFILITIGKKKYMI